MDKGKLAGIIREHKKWAMGEGGSRADLSGAYLSGAYLSGADLRGAYLSRADLSGTILENINWLAYIGIVPNKSGVAYAYKVTKSDGEGIHYSGINYTSKQAFEVEKVDPDVNTQCSYGINLATFSWCLNSFTDKSYRLFMFKFNVKDAVCPVGSDGKFRVKKCAKVGECNWQGNLVSKEVNHVQEKSTAIQ
uniref:Pentapeptide repeat-containing protein n=2 Tax=viral metagenome TaxID=1070528 RepID=A0A6M3IZA8_9ZZZZ